jgi:hypothetical protein
MNKIGYESENVVDFVSGSLTESNSVVSAVRFLKRDAYSLKKILSSS